MLTSVLYRIVTHMQEFAYTKKLMGTDVTVAVVTTDKEQAHLIANEAFVVITDYEQRFSRFLPTSELSTLNQIGDLIVSKTFLMVLKKSCELYLQTNKTFNPLFQIKKQGYDSDFQRLTAITKTAETAPYNTDLNQVKIDEEKRRVTLAPGQQLDFGGMLKGYLASKLAHELTNKYLDCTGLIINIGGDLHTTGTDENGEPFVFYLYNPITKEETPLPLTNTSLVTSGTYKRTWQTTNGPRHHILAKDGISAPTTNIVSVSITHKDGAAAEAYATLILVDGLEKAEELAAMKDTGYFVVKDDGATLSNII